MREKGIGIVQISQSAVAKVLETVQLYHNGGWLSWIKTISCLPQKELRSW